MGLFKKVARKVGKLIPASTVTYNRADYASNRATDAQKVRRAVNRSTTGPNYRIPKTPRKSGMGWK